MAYEETGLTEKPVIALIGTGMIASSMAALSAGHGLHTFVFARSLASENRCRNYVRSAYLDMEEQGLMTDAQREICETYVHYVYTYEELQSADIAFECIVENADEKHAVYRNLEENCPKLKAICSVSSSIVPEVLAEGMEKYGDRIFVTHPFNPAHMVPYFELCTAENTAPEAVEYAVKVLEQLDRRPVLLKKTTPGFIGNRLQFALLREALKLVEEGIADPEDIDTCLKYSFCPRYTSIGIFEHFDNGGLELCSTVAGNLFPVLSDEKKVPKLITDLMAEGKTGVKAGEGFYDWRNTDMEAYRKRVSEPYWKFCSWDFPEEADA